MEGRKVLWFLGAGASLGAGAYATVQAGGHIPVPTQRNFWQTFLRFARGRENKRTIESFLFRYFLGYDRVPSNAGTSRVRKTLNVIDVEEVFTFLSERARAPATSAQLRTYANRVWEALLGEIGNVFSRFPANASTRRVFRRFMDNHVRAHDAIVSFNYDTVFEDSLPASRSWGYEAISMEAHALPILKPHGSINWEFDPTAGAIEIEDEPDRSVVLAPTHLKFVSTIGASISDGGSIAGYLDQAIQIKQIWAEMERQMKQAKALVFIGYSFPVAALYFSSVLRSVLADRDSNPAIVLVNPDAVEIRKRLVARFAIQEPIVHYDLDSFSNLRRRGLLDQIDEAQG